MTRRRSHRAGRAFYRGSLALLVGGTLGLGALCAGLLWSRFGAPAPVGSRVPHREAAPQPAHEAARTDATPPSSSLGVRSAPVREVAPARSDDDAQMDELRTLGESQPELALAQARAQNQRFPESPHAAERASVLIHALGVLGRAAEARGEAEDMVNRYPDSSWVREVESYTGAHRRRTAYLTPEGRLAFR